MPLMDYVRLSRGLTTSELIPAVPHKIIEKIKKHPDKDYYISLYRYTDKHAEEFDKTHSVAGITDVKTDRLLWDFDSHVSLEIAQKDAKELCARLMESGVPSEKIRPFFSGNKGFHIEVIINETLSRQQFVNITFELAKGLDTFDTSINDEARVIRAPFTINPKSALYKIPLTVDQLNTYSIEDIKVNAIDVSKAIFYPYFQDKEWRIDIPEPIAVLKNQMFKSVETRKLEVIEGFDVNDIDFTQCPRWMARERYALQEGFFYGSESVQIGERNKAFMILAATYRNQGFSEDHALGLLEVAAQKQAARTKEEVVSTERLAREVIPSVYNPNWKGGIYSKDEPLLYLTRKRFNLSESENTTSVIQISDVGIEFQEFAKNIDKNTIKTGLKSLDDVCLITSGMMVSLLAAPGCHAMGSKILMFDGSSKNVEDVCVGDLLMGPDSKSREVLKLIRGKEEMVKITPFRSEPFIVNKNHILHLSQSKTKNKGRLPGNLNITVDQVIQGRQSNTEFISTLKLVKTGIDFNKKELNIDPYFLGTWLGDGTSSSVEITSMDKEILNYWKHYADQLGLRFSFRDKRSKAYTYSIVSLSGKKGPNHDNDLLRIFDKYALRNNKHIPQDYLTSIREDRLQLLAGLIDTDGHYSVQKNQYQIISSKKSLSEEIVFLARSLGFHASVNPVTKYCFYKGEKRIDQYFNVHISGHGLGDIPVKLERKKAIPQDLKTNPLHHGFNLEILSENDYYGFTISDDHLYLTSDFFIHHNCGKTSFASLFVEQLSKQGESTLFLSLDMYQPLLFNRLLQRYAHYPMDKILTMYKENKPDETLIHAYNEVLKNYSNVFFNFRTGPTVEDIEKELILNQEQSGKPVKLLVVDYLEKVRGPFADSTANTAYIASRLSDLAKKHHLTLLLLVQPAKIAGDPRDDLNSYRKIKGSSTIEQDSRVVLTLSRPGYDPSDSSDDNYACISVVKNNMGPLTKIDFGWNGLSGSFLELDDIQKRELKALRKRLEEAKQAENRGYEI